MLAILDGWGEGAPSPDNAIALARTPVWDRLKATCPQSHLKTAGLDVGLPEGQMGNSEVGHMNIGSGRIVMQDLPKIDLAIEDGSLAQNATLQNLIKKLKASGGVCHLCGLLSPGGVHAHQAHMLALVKILVDAGIEVRIHAFLDGRDTPPGSAKPYVTAFEADLAESNISGVASIATVSGRYYAMDRDNRWDRVQLAYDVIMSGAGKRFTTALDAIDTSYASGKQDEFVVPAVIGDYDGVKDGDGLLVANFRADRIRQICFAFLDPNFSGFPRTSTVKWAATAAMVEYSTKLTPWLPPLFLPETLTELFGEVISNAGKTQLRASETEKYAHVTFFFNGGREENYPGEDRILVRSPDVATYDLKPEMSAPELTDRLVEAIRSKKYDVIVVNYANTDMVGHTGSLEAAMKAVEAVDTSLGRLEEALRDAGGAMFITADHGNAEMMTDPETGEPHTAHTMNPVPFVYVGENRDSISLKNGRLCDIAPTLLEVIGLPIPAVMKGHSLIVSQAGQKKVG
jgi:2,3-bisphosphoglycerate-independent phosphoglycerate mutase